MKSITEVQISANDIVSFTDLYTFNKQRIEKEQSEFESKSSLTKVTSSIKYLRDQIHNNNTSKSVIQIPKLLRSLAVLSRFKIGTHQREEIDLQRIEVIHWSRDCLSQIQEYGDEQDQIDIVNQGFGRVISISYCSAGGVGEEQDYEIYNGLFYIYYFLRELHDGRNNWYPSFQPLPLLALNTEEQIEDEGANEEIDAQLNNEGNDGDIKNWANRAKAAILNHFIHRN
ncbi:MAG: hypothetical protein EZS28_030550 [Streblomastix strix]|uniref:Uncharacterized protein n=1 Tax=Streblomastix strix TaxID=222440 RepID=A0A5J4UUH2_9EUKA|nr:MAG: hypothetical protein EZS28_030550 [Streblomastix strix]